MQLSSLHNKTVTVVIERLLKYAKTTAHYNQKDKRLELPLDKSTTIILHEGHFKGKIGRGHVFGTEYYVRC